MDHEVRAIGENEVEFAQSGQRRDRSAQRGDERRGIDWTPSAHRLVDGIQEKAERQLGVGVAQGAEALGPEPRVGVDPGEPAIVGEHPGPARQLTLERVSVRP
ncbi:MAG TPA: hypothetical protein VF904_04435 [Anaeromyxobacteraceae bacterium]